MSDRLVNIRYAWGGTGPQADHLPAFVGTPDAKLKDSGYSIADIMGSSGAQGLQGSTGLQGLTGLIGTTGLSGIGDLGIAAGSLGLQSQWPYFLSLLGLGGRI